MVWTSCLQVCLVRLSKTKQSRRSRLKTTRSVRTTWRTWSLAASTTGWLRSQSLFITPFSTCSLTLLLDLLATISKLTWLNRSVTPYSCVCVLIWYSSLYLLERTQLSTGLTCFKASILTWEHRGIPISAISWLSPWCCFLSNHLLTLQLRT